MRKSISHLIAGASLAVAVMALAMPASAQGRRPGGMGGNRPSSSVQASSPRPSSSSQVNRSYSSPRPSSSQVNRSYSSPRPSSSSQVNRSYSSPRPSVSSDRPSRPSVSSDRPSRPSVSSDRPSGQVNRPGSINTRPVGNGNSRSNINHGGSTAGGNRGGNRPSINNGTRVNPHADRQLPEDRGKNSNYYKPGSNKPSGNYGNKPGDNRGGNHGNKPGDNRGGKPGDNHSNRPGMGNGNHGNHGNHGGNNWNNRPGNKPGGNMGNRPHEPRPHHGVNHGGPRPNYNDYRWHHSFRPRGPRDRWYDHYRYNRWSWRAPIAPPHRPWRPRLVWYYRPVLPVGYRYYVSAPIITGVLGLEFGTYLDASLNYLYYNGYNIDGYQDNVVYLRDVRMMGYGWPDVMLQYDDSGGMCYAEFVTSSTYRDNYRFNNLYNSLCATYGTPINSGNGYYSWYGGNGTGFINLNFNYDSGRYFTVLTFGT